MSCRLASFIKIWLKELFQGPPAVRVENFPICRKNCQLIICHIRISLVSPVLDMAVSNAKVAVKVDADKQIY